MFYRENGQFKSSYRADQQIFPILQDRLFVLAVILAVGWKWIMERMAADFIPTVMARGFHADHGMCVGMPVSAAAIPEKTCATQWVP